MIAEFAILLIEIEPNVVEQAAELSIDPNLIRVGFDRLAQFRRELVGMGDHLLDVTVLVDQLSRGFIADAGHAG